MNIASIIASRMGQNFDRISAAFLLKTLKKLKSFSWIIGCKTVLNTQCKKVKLAHQSPTPVRSLADSMCVKYVKACRSSCLPRFDALNQCLAEKQPYEHVFLVVTVLCDAPGE